MWSRNISQSFTFLGGKWIEGNQPISGARTHAYWLGSSAFDGARAFEGVTRDLDKHCARLLPDGKEVCETTFTFANFD